MDEVLLTQEAPSVSHFEPDFAMICENLPHNAKIAPANGRKMRNFWQNSPPDAYRVSWEGSLVRKSRKIGCKGNQGPLRCVN